MSLKQDKKTKKSNRSLRKASSVLKNSKASPSTKNVSNNEAHADISDQVKYHKTDNRELKLRNVSREWKYELDQARECRKSNRIQENFDGQKEILSRGYEIKNIIGSGSYAHVFRATDLNSASKRDVALKLIELEKCSKHYKKNFLRSEIHAIRQLNHENVVKFYEAFNTTQAYVMVMELVENGTFADLLYQNGAFGEKLTHKLFRGIAHGLNHMHNQSIAHRDLKLENLLLTHNMIPKISDFSLSLIWDKRKLSTDWCGTPPYFAPEILQKKPYNPLMYDIWSLGICLYAMVNDTIPFVCNDDQQMLQKQLKRDWKIRARYEHLVSNELKALLGQMLEPDFTRRISIQDIITHKWVINTSVSSS